MGKAALSSLLSRHGKEKKDLDLDPKVHLLRVRLSRRAGLLVFLLYRAKVLYLDATYASSLTQVLNLLLIYHHSSRLSGRLKQ